MREFRKKLRKLKYIVLKERRWKRKRDYRKDMMKKVKSK